MHRSPRTPGSDRSVRTRTTGSRRARGTARLQGAAGRARGGIESLEARIVLDGVPDFPNLAGAQLITLDGAGKGTFDEMIDEINDGDLYRIDLTTTDFVRILADAVKGASQSQADFNARVDTRLQLYSASGTLLQSSSNSGNLTPAVDPTEAWIGFVPAPADFQSGVATYYIRVLSDQVAGDTATGAYTLRVDSRSDGDFPAVDPNAPGLVTVSDTLTRQLEDVVYRIVNGTNEAFNSLVTLTAPAATLDTRLDVYDSSGALLAGDSQSGSLTNPFLTFDGAAEEVFFVRIRSDEFAPGRPWQGGFDVHAETVAKQLPTPLDPVRRIGFATLQFINPGFTQLYQFQALGTGRAIISAQGQPIPFVSPPLVDPTLRLFNEDGVQIATSTDFFGDSPQIDFSLVGGENYYIVLDDFIGSLPGATFSLVVESYHPTADQNGVDDHANAGDFADATPIVWNWEAPDKTATGVIDGSGGLAYVPLADHATTLIGHATGRLHSEGDNDLFVFVPPIDMLGQWEGFEEDADPARLWVEGYRPSTRVEIQVSPAFPVDPLQVPVSFANMQVSVFTQDGTRVYPGGAANDTIFLGTTDPAGSIDPARYQFDFVLPLDGPDMIEFAAPKDDLTGPELWGGRPYYILVEGIASGRYSVEVIVDNMPDPTDESIQFQSAEGDPDTIAEGNFPAGGGIAGHPTAFSAFKETRNDGQFFQAQEVSLGPATGDGTPPAPAADTAFNRSSPIERGYSNLSGVLGESFLTALGVNPAQVEAGNFGIIEESGGYAIEHPRDTDLFFFSPSRSGFAEIRINTTNLADSFSYFISDWTDADADAPTTSSGTLNSTYDSLLDSTLTIYNRDLEVIATNTYNPALRGRTGTEAIGSLGTFTFHERDARAVVPILAGEVYYIAVSSGQGDRYQQHLADGSQAVQWEHLIGSYELLVHTIAPPAGLDVDEGDDAQPFTDPIATTIEIREDGTASFTGEIRNTSNNAADQDAFSFISPASATATITVSPASGSSVLPVMSLFAVNTFGGIDLVEQVSAAGGGSATITAALTKGVRYYLGFNSAGATQGEYEVTITGIDQTDDHPDWLEFPAATEVELFDFLGGGSAAGAIEGSGDTDVFAIRPVDFTDITITVTPTGDLDPRVTTYEVSVDPVGVPILLKVGEDDDSGPGNGAQLFLPVNSGRISSQTGLEYPFYYIVVESEVASGEGGYNLALAFTPTDDHADIDQFELATELNVGITTGEAIDTGVIEIAGDTDLFTYTAPASGTGIVQLTNPSGSSLVEKITVLDVDGNEVVPPSDGDVPPRIEFPVVRGQQYFILIGASTFATTAQQTGGYTLSLNTPPVDDHPNADEFEIATALVLDGTTGNLTLGSLTPGSAGTPQISPVRDTDLFTFEAVGNGNIAITITPTEQTILSITPELTVFGPDQTPLDAAVIATGPGEAVSYVIVGGTTGTRYWILVGDDLGIRIGEYQLVIDGPPSSGGGGGGGGGDDTIDFDGAPDVDLTSFAADGSRSGVIAQAGETDAYRFVVPGEGTVYVQAVVPTGSLLNARLRIFNASESLLIEDSLGIPGASAAVQFENLTPGAAYFAVVSSIGNTLGSYTLRIDAPPEVFRVFYPEGFTGSTVREFVSLANPNDEPVTFTVKLRYETGQRDQTIASNTLAAGSRGGVTISNGLEGSPANARAGEPYAVIVESVGGPLAATMARYDFDSAIGDAFTDTLSPLWSFARVERNPGSVFDFVVFYNPHDFEVDVTISAATASGSVVSNTFTAGAQRRGGWNVNDLLVFPTGVYGVTVTAQPTDSANNAAFEGIVAALSHFDEANQNGYGLLGDPTGGGTAGAITSLTQSAETQSEIVLYNPNATPTSITLRGTYVRASLPDLVRVINLGARQTIRLTGAQLGLITGQPVGLTYTAGLPVSVLGAETQRGEANATGGATQAGTAWFFGDAFINTVLAGESYFETINFHNPAGIGTSATVELLFSDGTSDSLVIDIEADGFAEINLHETLGLDFEANADRPETFDANEILGRFGLNFFSISVTAPTPIVATLTHYDLFLRGGWGNSGAPFGLTNSLSLIG